MPSLQTCQFTGKLDSFDSNVTKRSSEVYSLQFHTLVQVIKKVICAKRKRCTDWDQSLY